MHSCPRCNYELAGLPEYHTCPECGFDYDPHCQMICLKPRRADNRQVVLGTGLLLVIGFGMWAAPGPFTLKDLILPGVILLAMLPYLYRSLRGFGLASALFISHKGVRFEHAEGASRLIPWDNIDHAQYGWLTGRVLILSKVCRVLHSVHRLRLGGTTEAKVCAEAIDAAKHTYETRHH